MVLGGGLYACPAPFGCSISLSMFSASAFVARGMIPGSEKLVLSKLERTKMKRTAPTTGMTGEIRSVRNGQSKAKKRPEVPMTRRRVT